MKHRWEIYHRKPEDTWDHMTVQYFESFQAAWKEANKYANRLRAAGWEISKIIVEVVR